MRPNSDESGYDDFGSQGLLGNVDDERPKRDAWFITNSRTGRSLAHARDAGKPIERHERLESSQAIQRPRLNVEHED